MGNIMRAMNRGLIVSLCLAAAACGGNSPTSGGTTPDPTPTVTLSASPTPVSSGGKSLLTWSSTNATSCTASGAWSGAEATSGSQSTSALTANSSYTLTCAGAGGNAAQSATVTVNAPAVSNVLSVVVDGGPAGLAGPSVNTLYTTVTVCVPGSTTQCQTIDNVQVDTQSYGLRILASVLTISLPVVAASDGNSLVECTQFVDGYSWGPVATADLQMSGETASKIPVQVIGSSNFTTVPAACSATGPAEDTVAAFGANGIVGIGNFPQDCGEACAPGVGSASIGDYYSCTATACNPITAALNLQVANPVPFFPVDNNGTMIILPSVAESGAATVTGSLIFGIDTESNNASGSQTVLTVQGSADPLPGNLSSTTFAGQTLTNSFIDSGSNALYFNDTSIAQCTASGFTGFYCPPSATNLGATLNGYAGGSAAVSFTVDKAMTQADNDPSYTAFATLAATADTFSTPSTTFDWGLPFFYGRTVINVIEGYTTKVGAGPYVAF